MPIIIGLNRGGINRPDQGIPVNTGLWGMPITIGLNRGGLNRPSQGMLVNTRRKRTKLVMNYVLEYFVRITLMGIHQVKISKRRP